MRLLPLAALFHLSLARGAPPPAYYASFADVDESTCAPPCARVGGCGYGTNETCDAAALAAACDAAAECVSFNSNGWLKGCAAPQCGGAREASPGTTLYVKSGGFWPPQRVAPVVDWHYAPARAAEEALLSASVPLLVSAGSGWAVLRVPAGAPPSPDANVSVGGAFAGGFLLLAAGGAASAHPYPASPAADAPFAVVERAFSTWAATSLLRISGEGARLPRTVGRVFALDESSGAPDYAALARDQPDYYDAAANVLVDSLGARAAEASPFGDEVTFAAAAAFLAPQRDYASIGAQAAAVKYSVAPDGRVKLASGDIYTPAASNESQPGTMVFDTAARADFWPPLRWTATKSGLVGGFLRVVATAAFDAVSGRGVEQLAFAPAADASGAALVRLRSTSGIDANGSDASERGYEYFNASAGGGVQPLDAASFYAHLFAESSFWAAAMAPAARVRLPGAEGARQVDGMWGGLVAALSLYVGNESNYGDGGAYWAPGGSLTSEVAPVVEALLSLGLRDVAAAITGLYFEQFVRADGSLPECDACADGGFGDALADYGEQLDIFRQVARAQLDFGGAAGAAWCAAHLPAFARLANFTLGLRLNASANGAARGDPTHGLVFGSPEHDTCHEPGFYFHNNAWLLRGLQEAASLLTEAGGPAFAPLLAALIVEAPRFADDLAASLALSTVQLVDGLTWLPPLAGANSTPFSSMTESLLASYSSFRYYPELVSAGVLADADVERVLAFREARGGVLLGMTRFEGHLDNMPAFGYARAALRVMDAPTGNAARRFWTLAYGHSAAYASRGTFSASEQLAIGTDAAGGSQWRDMLWTYLEGGIDQCVPSLVLATLATRWALAFEWRPQPDVLWLARGAPRRWYADGGFEVENLPTSFGTLSFSASSTASNATSFSISFAPPPFAAAGKAPLSIVLRVRALAPGATTASAALADVLPPGALVTLASFDLATETATVVLAQPLAALSFVVRAAFAGAT